jgi:predicted DNA-binding protein with PD1-like motif
MKSKLLTRQAEKTFALVFEAGEEVMEGLRAFAREQDLTAAHFTAIGAFRDVTLGWFNVDTQDYEKIPVGEQVEVLTLAGNVSIHQDAPKVHAHVVIGKRDGTAMGGHLLEAHVRPTLEVVLSESPTHLRRTMNERFGIPLIDPDAPTLPPRRGRELAEDG